MMHWSGRETADGTGNWELPERAMTRPAAPLPVDPPGVSAVAVMLGFLIGIGVAGIVFVVVVLWLVVGQH